MWVQKKLKLHRCSFYDLPTIAEKAMEHAAIQYFIFLDLCRAYDSVPKELCLGAPFHDII